MRKLFLPAARYEHAGQGMIKSQSEEEQELWYIKVSRTFVFRGAGVGVLSRTFVHNFGKWYYDVTLAAAGL